MTLYRHVLKAAARFPSKNRDGIVAEIKTEFRVARGETDGEVLKKKLALAKELQRQFDVWRGPSDNTDAIATTNSLTGNFHARVRRIGLRHRRPVV